MNMREEWLVVPLLLVVIAAAVGGHLFLRNAHERELDQYREQGRAELARWLGEEGVAAAFPDEWARRGTLPLRATTGALGKRVAPLVVTLEGTTYRVEGAFSASPWTFAEQYPAGLTPSALSNSELRMSLESGTAPISTNRVDDATREFVELASTLDLNRLRTAALPIGTKQFLLRRWANSVSSAVPQGEYPQHLREMALALESIARVHERSLSQAVPGFHTVEELVVHKPREGGPLAIAPKMLANELFPTERNVARALGNSGIALSFYATTHASKGHTPLDVVWHPKYGPLYRRALFDARARGEYEGLALASAAPLPPREEWLWNETVSDGPLAGTWIFRWECGPNWWHSPRYARRLPTGIAGLCIMLGGIALLWFGMRKQRKLNEARARFVNELAHDLRTPLTSLRLHTEMLESGRAPEARRGHYLGLIEREASRLSALLANLLDLSRLDGARAPLHLSAVSLASAANDAVRAFALVHPNRAGDVHVEGPSDAQVRADPAALARILGNLLENAGKFTKPGIAVRVTWEPVGPKWALRVADDGPGIAPDERRAVFRRYGRGARAKSDGVAGSGLGLALVRELAERMKGSVRLLPTTKGATFEIRLPREAHA